MGIEQLLLGLLLGIGALGAFILHKLSQDKKETHSQEVTKLNQALNTAQDKLKSQERDLSELKERHLQAQNTSEQLALDLKQHTQDGKITLTQLEDRLKALQLQSEKEKWVWEQEEGKLKAQQDEFEKRDKTLSQQEEEWKQRLESIGQLSAAEAKEELIQFWDHKLEAHINQQIKDHQSYCDTEKERLSAEILSEAIQRIALSHVTERTVSVINLPTDDWKGRIIGREGRNIRAFELNSGAEILIDDTPQVVVVSCFDPVRREVACRALNKMIEDGRIHPTRIEECLGEEAKALEQEMGQAAQDVIDDLEVHGLHPEIIRLLGRLKFRTSYGQNILLHSKEVAHAASIMAQELGVNEAIARRAGLLHDLGKALTHEEKGTHTALGVDFARKYGEKPEVLHAMAAHHFDVPPQTVEAVLVQVADTLSAARPGARSEPIERYMKRVQELELLVQDFKGVEKAFVVQAGREVRVIVDPDRISEKAMDKMALKIADTIEKKMDYPGQIKVSLIRELRTVRFAQ